MNEDQWLQDLKPGDKVFVTQKYGAPPEPQRVSRTTKAIIFIRVEGNYESKYRKSDGRSIGSSTWNTQWIIQCTPELEEKWDFHVLINKARHLKDKIVIPKDKESLVKFIEALTPFVP